MKSAGDAESSAASSPEGTIEDSRVVTAEEMLLGPAEGPALELAPKPPKAPDPLANALFVAPPNPNPGVFDAKAEEPPVAPPNEKEGAEAGDVPSAEDFSTLPKAPLGEKLNAGVFVVDAAEPASPPPNALTPNAEVDPPNAVVGALKPPNAPLDEADELPPKMFAVAGSVAAAFFDVGSSSGALLSSVAYSVASKRSGDGFAGAAVGNAPGRDPACLVFVSAAEEGDGSFAAGAGAGSLEDAAGVEVEGAGIVKSEFPPVDAAVKEGTNPAVEVPKLAALGASLTVWPPKLNAAGGGGARDVAGTSGFEATGAGAGAGLSAAWVACEPQTDAAAKGEEAEADAEGATAAPFVFALEPAQPLAFQVVSIVARSLEYDVFDFSKRSPRSTKGSASRAF